MSINLSNIKSGYENFSLNNVSTELERDSLTILIGPNGCGKSTLLKTIARHLSPKGGEVHIGGNDIAKLSTKSIAKMVSILPQHPIAPAGITVEQLVGYGRAPHQNFLGFKTKEDMERVDEALSIVSLFELRKKSVSELSGGQRQRAFIAMCIAQDTPYVLFDEPISFLDIKYQYEVLDLLAKLHENGKTIIAVLHDITLAARYASNLIVMRDGAILAHGKPHDVLTEELVTNVHELPAHIFTDPNSGTFIVNRY